MDYVVFGIGFGATILVLGLLLRDFGPRIRFRHARDGGDVLGAEELVAKVSWTRFCTALGSVLALAGAAFLLITLVAIILVVSDDTGFWIMLGAYGLLIIVMAYWTWAYFHRFGSYGILPERSEPEPALATPRRTPKPDVPGRQAPSSREDANDTAEDADIEPPASDAHDDVPGTDDGDRDDHYEADEGDGDDSAGESGPRLQTPEERLASAESPINHGSAEGDLDLAASGPRRPGTFTPRHPEENQEDADSVDTGNEQDDRAKA